MKNQNITKLLVKIHFSLPFGSSGLGVLSTTEQFRIAINAFGVMICCNLPIVGNFLQAIENIFRSTIEIASV